MSGLLEYWGLKVQAIVLLVIGQRAAARDCFVRMLALRPGGAAQVKD